MKRNLLLLLLMSTLMQEAIAQVTQINSNKSLGLDYPLSSSKSIYSSDVDGTVWVTDGTLAGTFQLSPTIQLITTIGSISFLNGKLIFEGSTPGTGSELYITDGTVAGTKLVMDINPGTESSEPDDGAIFNGYLYFAASRPAEGRELWRTDGTPAGTALVKDIVAGPTGSIDPNDYGITSNGSFLLINVTTAAQGKELWKSDGAINGSTTLLKDINAGTPSSSPDNFFPLSNKLLFTADDGTHGSELWSTDGSTGGTIRLADINPGTGSFDSVELFPGYNFSLGFNPLKFKGKAYFTAYNGVGTGHLWSTDGTVAGTSFVKDVNPGSTSTFVLLTLSAVYANKFIFSVADAATDLSELWQCDGTAGGTAVFKSFDAPGLIISPAFTFSGNELIYNLFQGSKFFFQANTVANGAEYWVSDGVDGTAAHTHILKDINPGADGLQDDLDPNDTKQSGGGGFGVTYTSNAVFFAANNGTKGLELWKSDGTEAGTEMVVDLVPGKFSSFPGPDFLLVNGKVIFSANNGDNNDAWDLYAVEGTFVALPLKLTDFMVTLQSADALLQWHTALEINSKDFTVQRSFDGVNFNNIGTLAAQYNGSGNQGYYYTDAGIANSGKNIVYYRLLSTDKDGKSILSPVITLNFSGVTKWNVRLLNNPVTDQAKILLSGIKGKVQLSIIDMAGKKIYVSAAAGNGLLALPADKLPRGTYFITAVSGTESRTLRFVK